MPFLRRFVESVMSNSCGDLRLPTLASPSSQEYRACVADDLSKWDKAVRVPFLTQELFEVSLPTIKGHAGFAGLMLELGCPRHSQTHIVCLQQTPRIKNHSLRVLA